MSLTKVNDEWVPLQIRVFTRWVNGHLKSINDEEIEDVTKDLSDGVHLVNLAQALTQKEPPRAWKKEPKMQVYMVQNCDLAIEMFTNDGIQLVGISGKDINDNNVKLILGLIWTLILNYSIGKSISSVSLDLTQSSSNNSSKSALMKWAVTKTANYPNVNPDFQPYDLSMCALLDSYVPDKINYNSLNPDETEHNAQLATDVMNELGIPVYIYPDDVIKSGNQVDDKTLLTQLSSAKVVLDNLNKVQERGITIEDKEDSLTKNGEQNSNIDQLRLEIQNEIKSSQTAIKCLKYEVKQLKKAIEGKATIVSHSEETSQVITLQKEEKVEIERLKVDISELRTQITNSNNVNSSSQNNGELEQLSKGREEDKAEIERLKNDLSELRSQIANSKNENASSQNNEDKAEIEHLKNDISELRSQIANSKNENASSQNNEEIERISKGRDEDKAEIERLRNDISELRTQLNNSNNENKLLKERIDSLSNEVKNNANNLGQLPEVKERSISLNNPDENEQLRKDVQSLQSEVQNLKSKGQPDNTKLYILIFIILIVLLICVKSSK